MRGERDPAQLVRNKQQFSDIITTPRALRFDPIDPRIPQAIERRFRSAEHNEGRMTAPTFEFLEMRIYMLAYSAEWSWVSSSRCVHAFESRCQPHVNANQRIM